MPRCSRIHPTPPTASDFPASVFGSEHTARTPSRSGNASTSPSRGGRLTVVWISYTNAAHVPAPLFASRLYSRPYSFAA